MKKESNLRKYPSEVKATKILFEESSTIVFNECGHALNILDEHLQENIPCNTCYSLGIGEYYYNKKNGIKHNSEFKTKCHLCNKESFLNELEVTKQLVNGELCGRIYFSHKSCYIKNDCLATKKEYIEKHAKENRIKYSLSEDAEDDTDLSTVIYGIVNKTTNRYYIGETIRVSKRFATHKKSLRENSHHSYRLQSDWNVYGESDFDFIIIKKLDKNYHVGMLLYYEYLYMKKYDSLETGYNIENTVKSIFLEGYRTKGLNDEKKNLLYSYLTTWKEFGEDAVEKKIKKEIEQIKLDK
jgi:hypothetical protein